jgi:hypothetical protein
VAKPLLTLALSYYNQPDMLIRQMDNWRSWPERARQAVNITVVDDGSLNPASKYLRYEPGLSLLQIDADIPWNRGMARNLATKECTTDWILHADLDHVLPENSAVLLTEMMHSFPPDKKHWYRFERYRVGAADFTRKKDKALPVAEWAKIHPHIDSYLCTPEAYWRAGGYNEDFSGVLGGGSPFLKEMEKANGEPGLIRYPLHVYTSHKVPDSSVKELSRDPALFKKRKAEIMKARGTLRGHDPIRQPWHKVF